MNTGNRLSRVTAFLPSLRFPLSGLVFRQVQFLAKVGWPVHRRANTVVAGPCPLQIRIAPRCFGRGPSLSCRRCNGRFLRRRWGWPRGGSLPICRAVFRLGTLHGVYGSDLVGKPASQNAIHTVVDRCLAERGA